MKTEENYNPNPGLSKSDWELNQIADQIVAADYAIDRIGILRKLKESYAQQIREEEQGKTRELAIGYAQYIQDYYPDYRADEWFDEWFKKQGGQGE